MARPIKETPTFTGEDAERFVYNMYHVQPVSAKRKREMREAYNKFKKMAQFPL